jgi:hypothetical protein
LLAFAYPMSRHAGPGAGAPLHQVGKAEGTQQRADAPGGATGESLRLDRALMSGANDHYDPKQVAILSAESLAAAVAAAEEAFAKSDDLGALAAVRPAHLGERAAIFAARRELGALPPAARSDAGKRVNLARQTVEAAYTARLAALTAERDERVLVEQTVDMTLPVDRRPRGARHPLTMIADRMVDVFIAMGYEVAEGPEVEAEWFNFDALNIGPDHPTRSLMDTFFVDPPESGLVLRTHTSPVQARAMLERKPPIYVVAPGGHSEPTIWTPPTRRSSPRSRAWPSTVGSPWRTCAAPWTTWPEPCSGRTRGPGSAPTTSRSPNRPPSSTSGSRSTATAPSGSSGVGAASSTRAF